MNLKSLKNTKYDPISMTYNIQDPSFFNNINIDLFEYTIQQGETMRPDLIMMSMYKTQDTFENWDVILYINGIENPINVKEGMDLLYPEKSKLDSFRYILRGGDISNDKEDLNQELSRVDKSTRKDKNREAYTKKDYQSPPVVSNNPTPPVRVVDGNITIGGI